MACPWQKAPESVQSRREAVWIGFKAIRFFLPARADELIGSEAGESLQGTGQRRGNIDPLSFDVALNPDMPGVAATGEET